MLLPKYKTLYKLFFLLAMAAAAAPVFAQDCALTLSGRVTDASTGEALGYATVLAEKTGIGAVTDESGAFALTGLCAGTYHIEVSHIGCHTERFFVVLRQDTAVALVLEHHAAFLEQVVVEGQAASNAGQYRQTLGRDELEQGGGQSIGQLVSSIAGVSLIRNGSGIAKPVIHGLSGNRVAILNNGLVQAGQQWGVDHAPEIDPFTADRITVIKGVETLAIGGNTLGGAVLVEPGSIGHDPHAHGAVQYVFDANGRQHALSARVEQGGKWADWRLTGTFKHGGDHRAPDYWLRNTGIRERNIAAQFQRNKRDDWFQSLYYSFFNTEIGILRGAHIGNLTDLQAAIGRAQPFFTETDYRADLEAPRQQVAHHLLKYNAKHYLGPEHSVQFTYGGQVNHRQEYDVRRGDRSDRPALDLLLQSHFADWQWVDHRGAIDKQIGVQYRFTDNGNQVGTGVLPLIPNYSQHQAGLFAIFKSGTDAPWQWQAGGRYDLVAMDVAAISRSLPRRIVPRTHTFHNYSVSGGLERGLGSRVTTKFNVGLTARTPEVNELYSAGLHQGVAGIEEGNPDLVPEVSVKGIWTNTFRWKTRLFVEAALYYQRIDNYIFLAPQPEFRLTIRGAFPVFAYDQTTARIAGADLTVKYAITEQWTWLNRFALVRGQDVAHDTPLPYLPADNLSSTLSHVWAGNARWRSPSVSVGGQYTHRQTRLLPAQDFLVPPPGYFLLNAQLSAILKVADYNLHIWLQGSNLLNTHYRDYLNRLRYYADEEGRNVRVNVRWEF